jgi:hypothetical protein
MNKNMYTRILHCSNNLENYYLCIDEKIAGFSNRGPESGDLVYLSVKIGKKSLCGARFYLDQVTDFKPWADAERYVNCFTVKNIEFCTPFEISILSEVGGKYWGMKYLQASKAIKDKPASDLLDKLFIENKTNTAFQFEIIEIDEDIEIEDVSDSITDKEFERIIKEVPDLKIEIMGTFQTIHFVNENNKTHGLETLVNECFYSLFPQFEESRTVLISDNRAFKTESKKIDGVNVTGISTIPDALLLSFTKNLKNPIQINLIEYECYGESKTKSSDKSNYLNTHIIPQLIRFASAFSLTTDITTRETSIRKWIEKILEFINKNENLEARVTGWIKEIKPNVKEKSIDLEIQKSLEEAFKTNVRVLLIIDELGSEQKDTIKNVIKSFKLSNNESILFDGYVVRLVQKINLLNSKSEFALTVQ